MGDPEQLDIAGFVGLLEEHADQSFSRSDTNFEYALGVKRNAIRIEEMVLCRQAGVVEAAVSTWWEDMKPIAERLFGTVLDENPMEWASPEKFGEFKGTVTPAVTAKLRHVLTDGGSGPMFALDVAVQSAEAA
jgi:hypothetical protein